MKGLIYQDGRLDFQSDLPRPRPSPGEALVKVLKAGICRTDLEIVAGYMDFSGIPGHEFVGIVEECADRSWVGQRVVGEINCGCGTCDYCKSDAKNHCPRRTVLGILGRNGAFAEYLTLPTENLFGVPESMSDDEAVFVEPVSAAFRIARQVELRGRSVLVLGDGKLGLLIAQVLSRERANVVLCGKHPEKLALLEGTQVERVLLRDLPEGSLYDVVVDATGRPEGLDLALSRTKPRGFLVLKTTVAKPAPINHNLIVINEITVVGSRCGDFTRGLPVASGGELALKPLIQKSFPWEEGIAAFAEAGKPGALKVLLG